MKNILNYYYGIIISNIDSFGYFKYQNHLFCLYEIRRNLDEVNALVLLNQFMLNRYIRINKIIFNNYQKPVTIHDNHYYVLVMIVYKMDNNQFQFIKMPNENYFNILMRNHWDYLWSLKVDYLESKRNIIKEKYPLINNSLDYYIGLSENAIRYFKMLNVSGKELYVCHRRIDLNDYYNPLELVLDYKVRDIGEFIKIMFFKDKKDIYEIKKFLNQYSLDYLDYLLLYNRLLYPSYYFDLVDRVIIGNEDEKILDSVISLNNLYEKLLYEIYLLIKRKYPIIGIDWLNK